VSHRIQDCIHDWDVEGEGETMGAALEAIAADCDRTASDCERAASELRKAAARYRAMRALCDEPEASDPDVGIGPLSIFPLSTLIGIRC
jgi:hypothetical protein